MNEHKGPDIPYPHLLSRQERPYYILSLLQERELLRAQAEQTEAPRKVSPAASIMAAALIEEILHTIEELP